MQTSEYQCANCCEFDCPGMIKDFDDDTDYQMNGHCPDSFMFMRDDV